MVDVHYAPVAAQTRQRLKQLLGWGLGVTLASAGAVTLLTPVIPGAVHAGALFASGLFFFAHALVLRWTLALPIRRLLDARRRLFARWIPRAAFLAFGTAGYGMLAVPVVNLVAVPVTFGGLTVGVGTYLRWSLERQKQDQPPATWELALTIALGGTALAVTGALVAAAATLGWGMSALLGFLQGLG
jgi:hypothetical protein